MTSPSRVMKRERDRTLTVEPESALSTTQGVGADAVVGADIGVAERADDHPHEDLVVWPVLVDRVLHPARHSTRLTMLRHQGEEVWVVVVGGGGVSSRRSRWLVYHTTMNSMLCRIACEIISVWCSGGGPNWSAERGVLFVSDCLLLLLLCQRVRISKTLTKKHSYKIEVKSNELEWNIK